MLEIKPMDESYLHLTCLHDGPVDTTRFEPPPDLLPGGHPPGPWDNHTLRLVVARYENHGVTHPRPAEFMREMIRRFGTCAILAWDGTTIVGHLRFYPMTIARMLAGGEHDPSAVLHCTRACRPEDDEGTLWVQCVMSSRPYLGAKPGHGMGNEWPSSAEAGARRGVGHQLVQGLITWAGEHGWQRIVKVAHADLDCFYGQLGGGGKAFWEKAGFRVAGTFHVKPAWTEDFMNIVERERREKGLTDDDVWTWYQMVYEFGK